MFSQNLRSRCRDTLLTNLTRYYINTVLCHNNEILVNLENLLDNGRVFFLGTNEHFLLGRGILTEECTSRVCIVVVIKHNWLILVYRDTCGMFERFLARHRRLSGSRRGRRQCGRRSGHCGSVPEEQPFFWYETRILNDLRRLYFCYQFRLSRSF